MPAFESHHHLAALLWPAEGRSYSPTLDHHIRLAGQGERWVLADHLSHYQTVSLQFMQSLIHSKAFQLFENKAKRN